MIHATFERLPEEKKERILAAARREFVEYPYEKSSINRILQDAKVPKGSFYQYFDDKVDLFFLCVHSVYQRLLLARQAHQEPLLNAGVIRMKELGYEQGYNLFTQDLTNYLSGEDFALFKNMLNAPDAIRNHVLMRVASELIAPIIKEELKSLDGIREDIDYDYYAYLLSLSEVIPVDYGTRHQYTMDEIMYLAYKYMRSIYDSILK